MGISRGAARLLLAEHFSRPFTGAVLELGRQHVYFQYKELQQWAALHSVKLAPVSEITMSNILDLRGKNCIDDVCLFKSLGFNVVDSCDVSDYEGATHVLDLNKPVPDFMRNRYDVIYDGGTIEHVFNLPQALRNIHFMLKDGGRIIHASPSTNHVDHGFYMFSPTLFYDYYSENRWDIVTSDIIKYTPRHDIDPWLVYSYRPGDIDHRAFGGFGKEMLSIFFIAVKTKNSSWDVNPQQFAYRKIQGNHCNSGNSGRSPILATIRKWLDGFPRLLKMARFFWVKFVLARKMPPFIAKY